MKTFSMGVLALILLAAGAGFVAVADTDWEGAGSGSWGDLRPFQPWQGRLHTDESPVRFDGDWGNDPDNWVHGNVDYYDSENGTYYVGYSVANAGTWYYDQTAGGKWKGWFHPSSPDTASGTWGFGSSATDGGSWWGDLKYD